jgi:hypothetical protein
MMASKATSETHTMSFSSQSSVLPTPTGTETPAPLPPTLGDFGLMTRHADPHPGETYLIVDNLNSAADGSRALALETGHLRLVPMTKLQEGAKWKCVDTHGWLGFQNTVSGTYLETSYREKIARWGGTEKDYFLQARSFIHGPTQGISIRRQANGEYLIFLCINNERSAMWNMYSSANSNEVELDSPITKTWEFIRLTGQIGASERHNTGYRRVLD